MPNSARDIFSDHCKYQQDTISSLYQSKAMKCFTELFMKLYIARQGAEKRILWGFSVLSAAVNCSYQKQSI